MLLCACTQALQALRPPTLLAPRRRSQALRAKTDDTYDAVVVGAGVGGLCTAALLARYDRRVLLVEAHDVVGGCAHSFARGGGYTCDSGPSLWAGCAQPSTSPLRQVLDAIGRDVDWVQYDGWGLHDLKADKRWRMTVGPDAFGDVMRQLGGANGERAWRALLKGSEPVVDAAMACPPMALRADPLGFVQTALVPYLLPAIFRASLKAKTFIPDLLTGASSQLFDLAEADNDFLERWIDYLAFALSGLPADGTVGAAVAYTLGDLHRPNAVLDYPVGGSGAVCEALADYISDKAGCAVRTRCRVDEILVDADGSVTGVRLASGDEVRCDTVVSNADAWTTATKLLKPSPLPRIADWQASQKALVPTRSFVHLWVGFDAAGLPDDLDCHHSVFNEGLLEDDCAALDAERNMYIISIPTLFDAGLAPAGKHLAHVYAAATEPYDAWAALDRKSPEYKAKKLEAAEPLWRALEAVVPDVRQRAEMTTIGTPLTHERFNNRHMGTYGPAGATVEGDLKGFGDGGTPVKGLWQVGDSQFPGIGLPAAAASGILVANALVSVAEHRALLDDMRAQGTLCAGKDWWLRENEAPRAPGGRIAVDASLEEVGCSV
jgi:phytoene dehydrogenase-like protein